MQSVAAQKQTIVMALIPMLLAGGGFVGWKYYQTSKSEALRDQVAAVEMALTKKQEEHAKKQSTLEAEVARLKAIATPKAEETTALTKAQADLQALPPVASAEAVQAYSDIFAANVKSAEGWRAGLALARIFIDEKKYTEAADVLKKIVDASLGLDFYQVQVRMMYIGLLEELGRTEEAAQEASKLVTLAPKTFLPEALFLEGSLFKKLGKSEETDKAFGRILSDFADSDEARRVRAIQLL